MNIKGLRLGMFFWITISSVKAIGADGKIETGQSSSGYQIVDNEEYGFRIENKVGTINYFDYQTPEGTFIKLAIPGYGISKKTGYPDLPVRRKLIELPLGCNVKIVVNNYSVKEYDLSDLGINYDILPVQPSYRVDSVKPTFQIDLSAYQSDNYITVLDYGIQDSLNLISIEKLGIKRNAYLARLNISPIKYNPVTGKLIVYDLLDFEVEFIHPDMNGTYQLKRKTGSMDINNNYLLNEIPLVPKNAKGVYESISKPIKYVIVADPMFEETLQPFILWKTKKGFNVVETYTSDPEIGGASYTNIKAYLQGLYDNATSDDPAPTFVLLVGDVAQVPTNPSVQREATHPTDFYYVEYTGDYLPEAYIGRLSATNTNELKAQIDKIIEYEKYEMSDPSFLDEAVLIAGDDVDMAPVHGNGQLNYLVNDYFNSGTGYSNMHSYFYPTDANTRFDIMQNINDGIGFLNYTGHGNGAGTIEPELSTSDFYNYVNNPGKYPVVIINGCNAGVFSINQCFGEYLMRGNNKGAVGYIGATNFSFWDEDFWWATGYGSISVNPTYESSGLGAFDRLFHTHGEPRTDWNTSLAEIIYAGNMAVVESGSKESDYYWEIYHVLGDPSLMLYLSAASPMVASYNSSIHISDSGYSVLTEPYAYVSLSTGDTLLGALQADSLGVADFTFTPFLGYGMVDMVITKQNKIPVFDSIPVIDSSAFIFYANGAVNDSLGNNNGLADYDETISMDVTLRNAGFVHASHITGTFSTSDNYVSITDSVAEWYALDVDSLVTVADAFGIKINQAVPDQHKVLVTLTMTDSTGGYWQQVFHVTVNSFSFELGDAVIIDTISGNGNGKIEAGETVSIKVPVTNNGQFDAVNLSATFNSLNSYLTVASTTSTLANLTIGAQDYFTFQVTADSNITRMIIANSTVTVNSYLPVVKAYNIPMGVLIEDCESTSLSESHIDWDTTQVFPWTFTDGVYYEGSQSLESALVDPGQSSVLLVNYEVVQDGMISFKAKCSLPFYQDKFEFYINDVLKFQAYTSISSWKSYSFPVSSGNTEFKWVFSKPANGSSGDYHAWLDYIEFPPVIKNDTITSIDNITSCESYTWIDGITYTESNNTATFMLNDTLFTINLTILKPDSVTTDVATCESYVFDGNILSASGQYQASFTNQDGCDSVVTLNLSILESSTGIDVISACKSYTWIDGNTYAESNNTATYKLTNAVGCDSIIKLDLIISADDTCNTNTINTLVSDEIKLFPNPTNGSFTLDLGKELDGVRVVINDFSGKTIFNETFGPLSKIPINIDEVPGVYFIHIYYEKSGLSPIKLIIQ